MARFPEHAALTAVAVVTLALFVVLAPGTSAEEDGEADFEAHKTACMNNVRNLAGLLEVVGRTYPNYSGPNLVLYFVKRGDIGPKHFKLLFCPGDKEESLKAAGGTDAYKDIDLKKQTHGKLSSYAGRDQQDKKCAAKRGVAKVSVLVCDDSVDHHGGRGIVVGLTGGVAKWRDKVKNYKLKADAQLTIGKGSAVQELVCLRVE